MKPTIKTDRATVYQSTWLELAATLPTHMEGASLAIVDGPYNLRKAAWDTFKSWDHFVEWYRPELTELTRVLAESANVYLWGTDTSASALRPLMAELGWKRRTRVIWDKVDSPALLGAANMSTWVDLTEVCDHYQRGGAPFGRSTSCIWRFSPANDGRRERLVTGGTLRNRAGADKGTGVVYSCRESLHPCQKPLAFYDRLIRSSSRVGDVVLEPYGGTLRAAVACQRLPPSEARRAIVCEPHGPYIEAVRPSLEWVPGGSGDQPSLFG